MTAGTGFSETLSRFRRCLQELKEWRKARRPQDSDALISLLRRESAIDTKAMLADSYSQAAAYVMVFVRFKNDRQAVCTYLVVSDGTLARRVNVAAASVRVQPSLFDYVERIHDEFMPQPGRQYAVRAEKCYESTQHRLEL